MGFQKFKTDSYCVVGGHRSATTKNCGDITSKGSKVLTGYCSLCSGKKSMTVSDNTIQAEGLGDFFKISGEKGLKVSKKAKNVKRILEELLRLEQNLVVNLLLQTQKQLYHHCLKCLISIIRERGSTSRDL